jgi:cysteine desulfurase
VIDLDQNATTRPSAGVVAAMTRALVDHWHNPSSVHRAGQAARQQVELARASLARLIGGRPRDVVLCSGGTEAIDLVLRGVLEVRAGKPGKPVLATTRVEHSAVRELAEALQKAGQAEVRWLAVDRAGCVAESGLQSAVAGATLCSVQWANNETGVVQPIEAVARACREAGAVFHCDATQWVGKEPTDVSAMGEACPDAITFSPHKFHGPKGVGVAWMRQGLRVRPQLIGTQELGRRGGTENVPSIVGAGVAAEEAMVWLADPARRTVQAAARDRFERLVCGGIADAVVNGSGAPRLRNTTNIGFPRIEAEALLLMLSERGVNASAGAACSSGSLDPSPVLLAMGIDPEVAHGSLRFSLGRETSTDEVERAARIVVECVQDLRERLGVVR